MIATILVENSSGTGWLSLVAHFYPYLGIDFVLDEKNGSSKKNDYEVKEYEKMVGIFYSNLKKKNNNDYKAHQTVLYYILQSAPNLDIVRDLFHGDDVRWFFSYENERVDFFVNVYKNITQGARNQKKPVGAKLMEFNKIPNKIRGGMNEFLRLALLEFCTSNDDLSDEHVKIFLKLIIKENGLHQKQIFEILKAISQSSSIQHHSLLLNILQNERFVHSWSQMTRQDKVEICTSWVRTRIINTRHVQTHDVEYKVVAVYKAIDEIMSCYLNKPNEAIANEISNAVENTLLKREDPINVFKAFSAIEKCTKIAQDCYKSHVRKILKNARSVLKRSTAILAEWSSSGYSVSILFHPLKIFSVVKQSVYKVLVHYLQIYK